MAAAPYRRMKEPYLPTHTEAAGGDDRRPWHLFCFAWDYGIGVSPRMRPLHSQQVSPECAVHERHHYVRGIIWRKSHDDLSPLLGVGASGIVANTIAGARRAGVADRYDRLRHSDDHRDAEQRFRGHALPRLSDLRGIGFMGSEPFGSAGNIARGSRRALGAGSRRQKDLDLPLASWREVSRRHGL